MKRRAYAIAIFVSVAILISVIINISLLYPFLLGIAFSLLLLSRDGLSVRALLAMAWAGVVECRELYLFILLIGANISVWMASGVVPAVMFYGFEYLEGMNFLFMAFLFTAVLSIFMGTAVGTISTLGIALLGIGRGFGIPLALLMGALVSGAYVADKISPISGLLNLTMKVTGSRYRQLLRTMAVTLVPVLVVSAVIYYLLGTRYSAAGDLELIATYQQGIEAGFNLNPLLLLFPLAIVALPMLGLRTLTTVIVGLAGGTVLALIYQGVVFSGLLSELIFGFRGADLIPELSAILQSGGVVGMVEVLFIVIAVIALGGILERSGALKPLIYEPIANVEHRGELIYKTGLIGSLLTVVTCDQSSGIVLPGRLYREKYRQLGLDGTILARTISDTNTIIAPLMPWNVNGIIIFTITGISALEYAPYAVLCYLFPLITVLVGFRLDSRLELPGSSNTPIRET
ncbi:MAG: sodium:proton antiporter [Firmicutes bacterium]|nr:sodium:proton antiporter [Bacillota bacterium]